jgi:hypothetical protein
VKTVLVSFVFLHILWFAGCSTDEDGVITPEEVPAIRLEGQITIQSTVDGDQNPETDYFGHLVGETVELEIKFIEFTDAVRDGTHLNKERVISATDVEVSFIGDPSGYLDGAIGKSSTVYSEIELVLTSYGGGSVSFSLRYDTALHMEDERYGFSFCGHYQGEEGEDGYPVFEDIPSTTCYLWFARKAFQDNAVMILESVIGEAELILVDEISN